MDKWVCILVSNSYLRRGENVIRGEIKKIFGKDFIDFSLTPSDNTEETYAFVKARNYSSHSERFASSALVKCILPNSESPFFLSDQEVFDFVTSATPQGDTNKFIPGDIVRVTKGYLSNLTGIVIGSSEKDQYAVVFRFYLRHFSEIVNVSCLERHGNIFDLVKFPVVTGGTNSYLVCGKHVRRSHVKEWIKNFFDEWHRYWFQHREPRADKRQA